MGLVLSGENLIKIVEFAIGLGLQNLFKCDSSTLHPHYIYPHYAQNCIETIR